MAGHRVGFVFLGEIAAAKALLRISSLPVSACVGGFHWEGGGFLWHFPSLHSSPLTLWHLSGSCLPGWHWGSAFLGIFFHPQHPLLGQSMPFGVVGSPGLLCLVEQPNQGHWAALLTSPHE